MLPNRLARRFVRISTAWDVCIFCRSAYPSNVFQRAYAIMRKAPSTKTALARNRARVMDDEEKKALARRQMNAGTTLPPITLIEGLVKASLIKTNAETMLRLLDQMREHGSRLDGTKAQRLCYDHGVPITDMFYAARACLYTRNSQAVKKLGKSVLLVMSALEVPQATLHLLRLAYNQQMSGYPGAYDSPELAHVRSHLRMLVASRHPEAMLLHAQWLENKGKRKEAIGLLREAILRGAANAQGAPENEEDAEALHKKHSSSYLRDAAGAASTSPYTILAHWERAEGNIDGAMAAFRIGADAHDDPEAFYYLAGYERNEFTAAWVENMTKAAASGHWRAMKRLGNFYSAPLEDIPEQELRNEMGQLEEHGRRVEWYYYYMAEAELQQTGIPLGTKIVRGIYWRSWQDDKGSPEDVHMVVLNARQALAVEWYEIAFLGRCFWEGVGDHAYDYNYAQQEVIESALRGGGQR